MLNIFDFVETCESNMIIGIYKAGAEQPEEEILISENTHNDKRRKTIHELRDKYGDFFITGFWVYNEETIAVNLCIK